MPASEQLSCRSMQRAAWRTAELRGALRGEIREPIEVHGFGEHAVEARKRAFGAVHVRGDCENWNGRWARSRAQAQARLDTIQPRHPEIQKHHVGLEVLRSSDGLE